MAHYLLTDEQIEIRDVVREVAEKVIAPRAAEIDAEEKFPEEAIAALAETGVFGIPYPEAYGGMDLDYLTYILALEEIAKACAATASIVATHGVGMYCLMTFGTEAQKAKYMPRMIAGELMGFAMTEAGAGSDASGMKTKAVQDGDDFVIDGTKMFISSAPVNAFTIVVTVTGTTPKGKPEFTAFIVDADTPGYSVGKNIHKMGIRGSLTAELIFDNCRVPASQMLGGRGEGMHVALASLDLGRISMGTQALGIAQTALDETISYVNERSQFGKTIASFQNTQFTLADLQTHVDAGRLLLWCAAMLKDKGMPFSKEAAMAKLYNSDLACEVADNCLQLYGGYGYTTEYPAERHSRDAKITRIYEGTNEIQKMVIGRAIGVPAKRK